MNPFTKHPRQQGITYSEHARFAMGIACRLFRSVAAFAVHAVFPFVSIAPELDLESTACFVNERNQWIEAARNHGTPDWKPGLRTGEFGSQDYLQDRVLRV